MKLQGIKGTISFNLSAVGEMSESVFVKKMDNQIADPKDAYRKLKAEIKRLADEEAKRLEKEKKEAADNKKAEEAAAKAREAKAKESV